MDASLKSFKSASRSLVSDSLRPHGLYSPWNSPGQNTGVGSLSVLQGVFSTQGSNPGLPHCRRILYHLTHKGSPRIPEWVQLEKQKTQIGKGTGSPDRFQVRGASSSLDGCREEGDSSLPLSATRNSFRLLFFFLILFQNP